MNPARADIILNATNSVAVAITRNYSQRSIDHRLDQLIHYLQNNR